MSEVTDITNSHPTLDEDAATNNECNSSNLRSFWGTTHLHRLYPVTAADRKCPTNPSPRLQAHNVKPMVSPVIDISVSLY